jgi:hypothetical protein
MFVDRPNIEHPAREAFANLALIVDDNAEDPTAPNARGHQSVAERMSRPGADDTTPAAKVAQISTLQPGMADGGGR